MLKRKIFIASTCFFQFLFTSSIAQTRQADAVDSVAVVNWLTKSFLFNSPDTGFIALEERNGFINPSMNATIKYISFPQKYIVIKNQFKDRKLTESTLFVDTIKHSSNGLEAFSLIQEEVSPDNSKHENYITLMTIVDFNDITACIIGAYPKSKDKFLREKFIKAALSIREQ